MKKSIIGIISIIIFVYFAAVFVLAEGNAENPNTVAIAIENSLAEHSTGDGVIDEVVINTEMELESAPSELILATADSASADTDEEVDKNAELYSTNYNPKYIQYDNIDLQSGAINIIENDLNLPGKNGLDVNIYRMYNSHKTDEILYSTDFERDKVYLRYYKYNYITADENNVIYIRFDEEKNVVDSFRATEASIKDCRELNTDNNRYYASYEDITLSDAGILLERDKTARADVESFVSDSLKPVVYDNPMIKTVDLQYGWDVIIPNLTWTFEESDDEDDIYYITSVFTDEFGRSYNVEIDIKKINGVYKLRPGSTPKIDSLEYSIIVEENINTGLFDLYFTNIEGQVYSIEDADLYNFDQIIVNTKKDRYNNIITYMKIDEAVQITDTYGRIITVGESGITVFAGEEIQKKVIYDRETVYDPDRDPYGKLTYFQENTLIVRESVSKDAQGNFTFEDTEYVMYPKEIVAEVGDPGDSITQYLLKSIIYPTGAKAEFEYPDEGNESRKLAYLYGNMYRRNYYYLYNPSKYEIYEKNEQNEYEYRTSYEYTFDDTVTTEIKRVYDNENAYYKTVYNYDRYDRLIKVSRYGYPQIGVAEASETYTYDADFLDDQTNIINQKNYLEQAPIKEISKIGYGTEHDREITYHNSKKQIVKIERGGNPYTYAYDSSYGFLLEETYLKDDSTKIIIRNTKTEDGKNIAKTSVYECVADIETLVTETYYTYNANGTLASETVSPAPGEEIKTEYLYTYHTNDMENYTGAYDIRKTITLLEGGTATETVTEVYEYDALGNLTSVVDANEFETRYVYDMKGRIIEEIYPDNTHKHILYNTAENSIAVTDENENTTVWDYLPNGIIEKIYIPGASVLCEYVYDGFYRLKEKKTYIDDERYLLNEYTYRLSGDLLSDKLSEFDGTTISVVDTKNYLYTRVHSLKKYKPIVDKIILNKEYQYLYLKTTDNIAVWREDDPRGVIYATTDTTSEDDITLIDISGLDLIAIAADRGEADYAVLKDYELGTGFAGYNILTTVSYNDKTRLHSESEYDSEGNIVRKTDYVYDRYVEYDDNLQEYEWFERRDVREFHYYYDKAGNLIKTVGGQLLEDGGDYSTKTEYDALGNPVKEYLPMLDGQTEPDFITYEYDNIGRLTKSTDVNGNETLYTYDVLGRVIKTVYPFDEERTREVLTFYDGNGNVIKTMEQDGMSTELKTYKTTEYEYDSRNRVITQKQNDGTRNIYTQYGYDNVGNLLKVVTGQTSKLENVFTSTIPANAAVTTYEYDRFGNVTEKTDALNQSETYEYNLMGWQTEVTDRDMNTLITTYNAYGSPLTVGTFGGVLTTNTYNVDNMLISTSSNENTISYEYDELGNMIHEVQTATDVDKTYGYDIDGNRTRVHMYEFDNLLMSANYTYDNRGRVTEIVFNDTSANVTYEYYPDNSLKKETRGNFVTDYEYNEAGLNTLTETTNNETIVDSNALVYALDGNTVSKTTLDGITNYTYDKLGQLKQETKTVDGNTEYNAMYSYDTRGNRLGYDIGPQWTNYQYDKNNRLIKSILIDAMTISYYVEVYMYDANGNVWNIDKFNVDSEYNDTFLGYDVYNYDEMNRIETVTRITVPEGYESPYYPMGSGAASVMSVNAISDTSDMYEIFEITEEEYEIMCQNALERREALQNGEITFGMVEAIEIPIYEEIIIEEEIPIDEEIIIDESEEISEEEQTTESEISEESPEEITEITDEENAEITVEETVLETEEVIENETAELSAEDMAEPAFADPPSTQNPYISMIVRYVYNPDGTRASKAIEEETMVTTVYHIWDGANIVMDNNVFEFSYGDPFESLLKYYRGIHLIKNNSTYYIYDNYGDIIATASANGNVSETKEYNAFGVTEMSYEPFGYRGEYTDYETGYVYLRNRYYNPETGRFLTEDPIQDGLNWYAYCENNPIRYIDPTGYITQEEIDLYNKGQLSQEVYDILVDLGNRWTNAKTDEARNEIHGLAEQFRNNNYKYQDLSNEANAQLWENGQKMYLMRNAGFDIFTDTIALVGTGIKWYSLVDKNKLWDYKSNSALWMPKEETYFMMYGELISFADFGNINYGYTGTALGLSPKTLYKGAGYIQSGVINNDASQYYGDSEVDFNNVKRGIEWANRSGYVGVIPLPLEFIFGLREAITP